MEHRIRPTRSGLFAIELLIAVGIFTLCAAICVGLFVRAEVQSSDSVDLIRAVNEARSVAECFKSTGGDLGKTAEIFGVTASKGVLTVSYDEDWNQLKNPGEGTYYVRLKPRQENGYVAGELWVVYESGGTQLPTSIGSQNGSAPEMGELLRWDIAALEVTP